jgi:hypothetical protein
MASISESSVTHYLKYLPFYDSFRPPLRSSGQSSWLRKADASCFLCGTNWIYICYVEESRLPLWSSSQSSWLQRSWFDSRRYQNFWEVVGLERGPLSLVSTIEGLLGRKNSGSGLDSREYGRRAQLRCTRGIQYPKNLALTSPTSGGLSVGIVRLRVQATELLLLLYFCLSYIENYSLHERLPSSSQEILLSISNNRN